MNNIFYFRAELCIECIEINGEDDFSEEFSYILLLQEEETEDMELGISNRLYGLKKQLTMQGTQIELLEKQQDLNMRKIGVSQQKIMEKLATNDLRQS